MRDRLRQGRIPKATAPLKLKPRLVSVITRPVPFPPAKKDILKKMYARCQDFSYFLDCCNEETWLKYRKCISSSS